MLRPIKDYPNYKKDVHSNAIISVDKSGYKAALKRREYRKQQEDKIQNLEKTVSELQSLVNSLIKNK